MPLSYTIDRRLKIVVARASGVLSEEDLRGSREQIQSDPAYSPSFAQLFDLSDVTDIEVSIPVMARIAGSSTVSPGARRAFVGVNDIQYEMARTFAALSEPVEGGRDRWWGCLGGDDARGFEALEAVGQQIGRDAGQAVAEVRVATRSCSQLPHDEQRPAVAHDVEGLGDRAELSVLPHA